jgi:integrase
MKTNQSRKRGQAKTWPKSVQPGRAVVKVYRRKTPAGNFAFMVANYADGERRRFDSYANEADAIAAATKLAQRLDSRDYVAASLTKQQAIEFANAEARLKPFDVTVDSATATVAECLKILGDLANMIAAAKFYRQRHKQVVKKTVPDLVDEFLELKKSRGASPRYLKDLHWRLKKMFAADCTKEAANVTTADIQDWLDAQKLAPQNYRNFRTTLNTLFEHASARSYTFDNPVEGVEKIKVPNGGSIAIFTPVEIAKLLSAASPDFLPVIALGAFAGLRTAEIERLEWRDIDFAGGFIHVSADKAKTASRRLVPIQANLAQWLATYAKRTGKVWQSTSNDLQDARAAAVKASGVAWKDNGLRHSFISYRLAEIQDAAKVALEAGNSPNVVFKYYRELVKPSDAVKWFNVKPDAPANVLPMRAAATANP